MSINSRRAAVALSALVLLAFSALAAPQARADVPLGAAADYAVLYEGTGGHNLQIGNVTINGNIGVGGTGVVQNNGPSTITGRLDFSAANTGQYKNNNSMNVGPTSVNYSVSAVTTALNTVNSLNSSLSGGNSLAISGTQTINESAGKLVTVNGTAYRLFNITSYSETDGKVVTINGDGSGNPVVFNFAESLGNINLKGLVTLTGGLDDDSVLWNFAGAGKNINLNTNNSSYPTSAFQGIILAPGDVMSMNAANLDGRFFGGDSSDMQIVSHSNLNAPPDPLLVPEPSSALVAGFVALLGLGWAGVRRVRHRSA